MVDIKYKIIEPKISPNKKFGYSLTILKSKNCSKFMRGLS